MSQPPPPKPPGWYPDPYGQAPFRWWDGTNWGQQTSQAQTAQSKTGARGWKLFLIITAAIVVAVVILVVGCSAMVSSSLDTGGAGGGSSDSLTRSDLPSNAVLIKRVRDKGENPDFGLDATFPASKSRFYFIVETNPPAKVTAVTSVTCQTPDYSKSVNRDLDISDLLSRNTSYGTSFKLPKGWKRGWTCDLTAMGRADSDEGTSTTVTSRLYRSP